MTRSLLIGSTILTLALHGCAVLDDDRSALQSNIGSARAAEPGSAGDIGIQLDGCTYDNNQTTEGCRLVPSAAWSFNECDDRTPNTCKNESNAQEPCIWDGAGHHLLDGNRGRMPNHLLLGNASTFSCGEALHGRSGRFLGGQACDQNGLGCARSRVAVGFGSERTLTAWVLPENVSGSGAGGAVLAGAHGQGSYALRYHPSATSGEGSFRLVATVASSTRQVTSDTVAAGKWHHVVAVIGPQGNCPAGEATAAIYLNGDLASTPSCVPAPSDDNARVRLGEGFHGQLDEVALYNTAMDAQQVAALYGEPQALYLGADTNTHPEDGEYPKREGGVDNPIGYDFYAGRLSNQLDICHIQTYSGYDIVEGEPVQDGTQCQFDSNAAAVARPHRTYGYAYIHGPTSPTRSSLSPYEFGAAQANVLIEQWRRYRHVVYGHTLFCDIEEPGQGKPLIDAGWPACAGDASVCRANQLVLEGFLDRVEAAGFTPGVYTRTDVWNTIFGADYSAPRPFVAWITGGGYTRDDLPGRVFTAEEFEAFRANAKLGGMHGAIVQYHVNPDYNAVGLSPTGDLAINAPSDTALIIDSSGSMSTNDRFGWRRLAAIAFLAMSAAGDRVGVVDFDSNASINSYLRVLPEEIMALVGAILAIDSLGSTNIGLGVDAGLEVLDRDPLDRTKAAILLTDGVGSYADQHDAYQQQGRDWAIHTLGFGSADGNLLRRIADETGGEYNMGLENQLVASSLSPEIMVCAFQHIRSRIDGGGGVACTPHDLAAGQTLVLTQDVGLTERYLTVSASWPGIVNRGAIRLIAPSGRVVDPGAPPPNLSYGQRQAYEVYRVDRPMPGTWTIEVSSATRQTVIIGVTSSVESGNQPPDVSAAEASPSSLWPPNHRFVDIEILGVSDPDGDPFTIEITGITQDEPVDGHGSGQTGPDASGVGQNMASVRAERAGDGDGRVYRVSFVARDSRGAEATGLVDICVPHDQNRQDCTDSGQHHDSTLP